MAQEKRYTTAAFKIIIITALCFLVSLILFSCRSNEEERVLAILEEPDKMGAILANMNVNCQAGKLNIDLWRTEFGNFISQPYELGKSDYLWDGDTAIKIVTVVRKSDDSLGLQFVFKKSEGDWCLTGVGYTPRFDIGH